MKTEYKIVELKKKSWTKGAMKTEQLEEILNQWGSDGWILDRVVSAEVSGTLNIGKDVLLIIFKRQTE